MVCPDCMDEDHPQWFPARIVGPDPKPIPNARPDLDQISIVSSDVVLGQASFFGGQSTHYMADTARFSTNLPVFERDENGYPVRGPDGGLVLTEDWLEPTPGALYLIDGEGNVLVDGDDYLVTGDDE